MAPRRGPVVRPVLDATRSELQQYLRDRGETWREDATNLDRTIPRNFVRHEVLPRLRTINAQADNALARAADMLRVDADFLETLANAKYLQIVETDTEQEKVDCECHGADQASGGAGDTRGAVCARNREPVPLVWLRRGSCIAVRLPRVAPAATLSGLAMERLGAKVVLVSKGCTGARVHRVRL